MLEKEMVYFKVDEYFNSFGLKRVFDEKLRQTDCYYIDSEEKKYIFVCKVFTDKRQLMLEWESSQDEDIALYLQQKKYSNSDIRWDMYFVIIYIGDVQLDVEEFNTIEKDRFCCKKLVLNIKDENNLIEEFNNKLPFTKKYFKLSENNDAFSDSGFLKLLNNKSGIGDDIITLQLLGNLTEEKDELVKRLLKHELDASGERNENND
jgi:hypothetical protein